MLCGDHRSGSALSVNSKVVETYTSVQLLCCKLSVDLNNKDFKDVQAFPDLSLYGKNILGHTLAPLYYTQKVCKVMEIACSCLGLPKYLQANIALLNLFWSAAIPRTPKQ